METPGAVALDAQTPLGFSAAALLSTIGKNQESDLKWLATSMYASHGRGGTTTKVNLGFTAAAATFVDSKGGGCPTQGEAPCIVCQPRLEVSVGLTMATTDGALDEEIAVKLVTSTKDTATMTFDLPVASLEGAYFDQVTPEAGYEPFGLHVEASFGGSFPGSHATVPGVWNGYVAATVRTTGSTSTTGVNTSHGYFPPETGP